MSCLCLKCGGPIPEVYGIIVVELDPDGLPHRTYALCHDDLEAGPRPEPVVHERKPPSELELAKRAVVLKAVNETTTITEAANKIRVPRWTLHRIMKRAEEATGT